MRAIDLHQKEQEIDNEVIIPWHVWTKLNTDKKIERMGNGFCLGADFSSVEEIRKALDWMVDQFGGKTEWDK